MAFTSKFEEVKSPSRHWDTDDGDARSFAEGSSTDDLSVEGSRARLAFYEKLVDDAPGALFQLERRLTGGLPDYQFTFVATGVNALLGASSGSLEADPFGWMRQVRGAMGEDARSILVRAFEQSADSLTPVVWQGCVHTLQGDRWVQAQARPSGGPEGCVRWTGIFTDITDHKLNLWALEGALSEATELAVKERLRAEALRDTSDDMMEASEALAGRERVIQREKAVALARLARGLAHEISNPLSGVQHMLEALRAPQGTVCLDDARRVAYLNLMQAGLVRIESTVSNLLQYAQDNVLRLAKVEAGAWVEEALAQLRPTLADKNITLHSTLSSAPLPLLADKQQLVRALVNVLQNAAHASPRDATLDVDTVESATGIEVAVRDHGAGIPAEYRHRVCDPFFTTKQQGDGNGLGLSVAQQIAAAHGGELRVETPEGDGTRVVIAIPKAPPDESAQHPHQ